jgi:hypothetical protein
MTDLTILIQIATLLAIAVGAGKMLKQIEVTTQAQEKLMAHVEKLNEKHNGLETRVALLSAKPRKGRAA